MKRVIFCCLILGIFLMGCAARQPSQVCPPPENQPSWLCQKSAELDITLEQTYGFIFSASAISVVTDLVERQWICDFKKKISDWYVETYPITYDSVIQKVIIELKLLKDQDKILLIKNILNQNMALYSSASMIGEYDDWLLRAGSNKFDQDMLCK